MAVAPGQLPATLRAFASTFGEQRVLEAAEKYRIRPPSPEAPLSESQQRQLFIALIVHDPSGAASAAVAAGSAPRSAPDEPPREAVQQPASAAKPPDGPADQDVDALNAEVRSLRVQVTALTDRLIEARLQTESAEQKAAALIEKTATDLAMREQRRVQLQVELADRARAEADRLRLELATLQQGLRASGRAFLPTPGVSERDLLQAQHELRQANARAADLTRELAAVQQRSRAPIASDPALARENAQLRAQLALVQRKANEHDRIASECQRQLDANAALRRQLEEAELHLRSVSRQLETASQRRPAPGASLEVTDGGAQGRPLRAKKSSRGRRGADAPDDGGPIHQWASSRPPDGRFAVASHVAVCGTGPGSAKAIRALLERHGSEAVRPGDPRAAMMILGREGWFIDDIEEQIRARSGQRLCIFSQEMFRLAAEVGADPFATADARTLRAFAEGHPGLACCIEEGFSWPTIPTGRIALLLDVTIEQVAESPLHKMGYRVGKNGEPERTRRRILASAFSGELPHVESNAYMASWGRARSRRRLRRMARLIAWQVGGARGRAEKLGQETSAATHDWREDLEWMRRQLYEPWMRFRWPAVKVPGR